MKKQSLVQGNEACALGALYAGCNFYAGYPITPSTEIMEVLAMELPKRGAAFIQMEDEIASISAVVGASWTGSKAMTATSGPGFSLMQEGIGYASATETPCVIINAQRWGPSTGLPTKTAQGDVMQAIWGTHGDHAVIVLAATHVRDAFELTVTAFNFAERYRVPVILLLDEVLSHMRQNMAIPEPGELEVVTRQAPSKTEGFEPFASESFLAFGDGGRIGVTGLAHDQHGRAAGGKMADRQLRRMIDKIQSNVQEIARYEALFTEDAEALIVTHGILALSAERACQLLREQGVRAGLLTLKTLWPFPDFLFERHLDGIEYVLVPEMNLGQVVREVERAVRGRAPVEALSRVDSHLITPHQICDAILTGIHARRSCRTRSAAPAVAHSLSSTNSYEI